MSLSLDALPPAGLAPEVETSRTIDGSSLAPPRSLPDPAVATEALTDRLDAAAPGINRDQASVLVAASALMAARETGHERPDAYAASVVAALGAGDSRQTVALAQSYLDGGGTVPEALGAALHSRDLLAQTPSVGDLSGTQRADFSLISDARRQELDQSARDYVRSYADGDVQRVNGDFIDLGVGGAGGANVPTRETYLVPRIDFVDLKNILEDLMGRTDMGDIDKAYVWNQIASAKGQAGLVEYDNAQVHIENRGVRDYLLDDHWTREWNTSNHTVVPFTDGYHGFGNPNGREPGMGYVSEADAYNRIQQHEEGWILGLGANPGDRHASMATVAAFHAWRDAPEGQRFNAFAQTWIEGVIDPNLR